MAKIENKKTAKERKAYPSLDERLVMVNQKIEQLEKLNAGRRALIEKTETTLNERKEALRKSEAQLEKALNKKQKLIAIQKRPTSKAANRAMKSEEKKRLNELYQALKAKGKSVEDLLAALEK
ncbi:MAG: hypothetical protein IJC48_05120 [Clostridia bacterium]|nr:hypothetical protein [Clostridia bacterium]